MMISAKSRYALRVMVDLAQRNTGEFIPVKEIAARQGISLKYLESIMTILTKGKMLESASGKGGGYRLVRKPCAMMERNVSEPQNVPHFHSGKDSRPS